MKMWETGNNIFDPFQRLLLSVSPSREEKDILEGKAAPRASIWHWLEI